MKRHTRLTAKTRLSAKKPLERRTPMPRGKALDRLTSAPIGQRAEVRRTVAKKSKSRPPTAPKSVIDLVKGRSGGRCEIGLLCLGREAATQSCHRMGKGMGGVGRKNTTSNVASDLVHGCDRDHELIDNVSVRDAERLGLKIRHGIARPDEMPVYLFGPGWVLLDNEGGMRTAPRTAWDRPDGPLPVIQIMDADDDIDEEVPQAVARWGHRDCGGWTFEIGDVCRCSCETDLFVVEAS